MSRVADVLILGAGPAGAALALALKRAGVADVVIVDHAAARPARIGEAAAPGLARLLRRLGLDDRLKLQGHVACHGNRSLWGGGQPSVADFMTRAQGPGWHLDRLAFDKWLLGEACKSGAGFLSPARLEEASWRGDRWQARLSDRDETALWESRWIVDATGRPAAFARRHGARLRRLDRLIALAVLAEPGERAFEAYSQIESCEHGWWYAARLPGGKTLVSLMTDSDISRGRELFSAGGFVRAWRATKSVARFAEPVLATPNAYAATTQFIDQAIGPGWLALGDALMAFDPLSASGITGAIEDAIAAADLLAHLLERPLSNDAQALRHTYGERADADIKRFMKEQRAIYGMERRWPESPFWRRRAAPYTARPASIPS